jgi:hypothetical protein
VVNTDGANHFDKQDEAVVDTRNLCYRVVWPPHPPYRPGINALVPSCTARNGRWTQSRHWDTRSLVHSTCVLCSGRAVLNDDCPGSYLQRLASIPFPGPMLKAREIEATDRIS